MWPVGGFNVIVAGFREHVSPDELRLRLEGAPPQLTGVAAGRARPREAGGAERRPADRRPRAGRVDDRPDDRPLRRRRRHRTLSRTTRTVLQVVVVALLAAAGRRVPEGRAGRLLDGVGAAARRQAAAGAGLHAGHAGRRHVHALVHPRQAGGAELLGVLVRPVQGRGAGAAELAHRYGASSTSSASTARTTGDARSFAHRYGLDFTVVHDRAGLPQVGPGGLPETFVIDRQGKVVKHFPGQITGSDLEAAAAADGNA